MKNSGFHTHRKAWISVPGLLLGICVEAALLIFLGAVAGPAELVSFLSLSFQQDPAVTAATILGVVLPICGLFSCWKYEKENRE